MSDSMQFDVVIVGAGPSGLAAAIRLKQLAKQKGAEISVCVLEKGAEVGSHIMSGAVLEPRALNELIPDWKEKGAPVTIEAAEDKFLFLTKKFAFRLPTPKQMHNKGNYIISLGNLCKWLAAQAQEMGVDIFTGFAAAEMVMENNRVVGVKTGDMGLDKHGNQTAQYQPGVVINAKQTILAEGCHGSLTKKMIAKFNLRHGRDPQTYGLGIKEIWQADPALHKQGLIVHSVGWPLRADTYGGSFLYHFDNNQIAVGFVVGLDYSNPYLSPFEEFQRFKTHPKIAPYFKGGKRISYGARTISEGGFQSIPKLTFPGGMLIGDTAGFLNVPKIKGTHTAMKSGMIAAECLFDHLTGGNAPDEADQYEQTLKSSWVGAELYGVRNIRPSFHFGLWAGIIYSAIDTYIFRGRAPWTLRNRADHTGLKNKQSAAKIEYPKPDGVLTFDRMSSVYLSSTNHAEDQPCHLQLRDPEKAIKVNYDLFAGPESRYCPAGVYEFVDIDGQKKLQINAANCVHCKTCDIKDPSQNIDWVPPQGGEGPSYTNM
ncbi:MAG: electron transfer flavoprotein-ubiquinone oxidoreductase [Alphaproteobacteria bacterium]|nr:MAG: electron transfer flavoprotein-ubiquinone oxidoreductase [Alphaproteobacteria bacterium]